MAEDRRQLLEQADRAARKGDLAAAAVVYRKLVAQYPSDQTLAARLGDALARGGQAAEARPIFVRLAEDLWRDGHKARSIALVRRAARLEPPDPALLELCGERSIASGLAVDAREPLLEAGALFEQAGDIPSAERAYAKLAEAMPRELAALEALVRVADRRGAPAGRARTRMALALAAAQTGAPSRAAEALGAALVADPVELSALDALADLVAVLRHAGVDALDEAAAPSAGGERVALGRRLAAAALRARGGDESAAEALGPDNDAALTVQPVVALLWRGRVLLACREVRRATAPILSAAQRSQEREDLRAEVIDLLSELVTHDPAQEDAMRWLLRLSPSAPEPVADAAPDPEEAVTGPDDDLPTSVRALLIEVTLLVEHGMTGQAARVMATIAPQYREHADVKALAARLRPSAAPRPAPPRAAVPVAPAAPVPSEAEDSAVVIDFDGPATGPAAVQAPAAAEPPHPVHVTAPVPRQGGAPCDIGDMQRRIVEAIPDDDVETSYQMGLGLAEMGLEDQALPLLESALGSSARGADAALLIVRILERRGESERALSVARQGLAVEGLVEGSRVALLTRVAALCEQLGRPEEAVQARGAASDLVRQHPELREWSGEPDASRS